MPDTTIVKLPDSMKPDDTANKFGTFGGVFTPSILTILGAIMFLRANFVVGEAGVFYAVIILLVAKSITFLTSLSIGAISTNMQVRGGGAYFMISRVLGPEFGGAIGIALFSALALSVPFYILAFTEALTTSVPVMLPYFQYIAFAAATVFFIIAYVGASWAIRAQYIIMAILFISIIAFMSGAVMHFDMGTLRENWSSSYTSNPGTGQLYNFWLIFAIYFPAVTGIDAGVNMSGDLKEPSKSIPLGTLCAVGLGFLVYLTQIVVCGGAFSREELINRPFEILGENALLWGGLVAGGVYAATLSSALGSYLAGPRVLQAVSRDPVLPFLHLFGKGTKKGDEPRRALILVGIITVAVLLWAGSPALKKDASSSVKSQTVDTVVADDAILHDSDKALDSAEAGHEIIPSATNMEEDCDKESEEHERKVAATKKSTEGDGDNALNVVAAIVTMFFLFSYGTINVAAFTEAVGGNPSFRPRFKFFHWATALVGTIVCISAAMLIDAIAAIAAGGVIVFIVWYVRRQHLRSSFGDARRGFIYQTVRDNLLRLGEMKEDSRNWRPTVLVFSGNPESRELLVSYGVWLEAGRGVVFMANILVGDFEEYNPRRPMAIKQLKDFCKEKNIHAFPLAVVADSVRQGTRMLLQTAGVGPLRANMAVFGWTTKPDQAADYIGRVRVAADMGMSLVLIEERGMPIPDAQKRVDVWWRGHKNGSLMMLLTYLMTQNWEWSNTSVRVLRVVEKPAGREPAMKALQDIIDNARLDATAETIVSDKPFAQTLHEHSRNAACVFLGMELPSEGYEQQWHDAYSEMLEGMPTTIIVNSAGGEDMLA